MDPGIVSTAQQPDGRTGLTSRLPLSELPVNLARRSLVEELRTLCLEFECFHEAAFSCLRDLLNVARPGVWPSEIKETFDRGYAGFSRYLCGDFDLEMMYRTSYDANRSWQYYRHEIMGCSGLQGVLIALSSLQRSLKQESIGSSFPQWLKEYEVKVQEFKDAFQGKEDALAQLPGRANQTGVVPPVATSIREVIEELRTALPVPQQTCLRIVGDGSVIQDRQQLTNIFRNLLANSLRAIRPRKNGEISVAITTDTDRGELCIDWKDNGPGFPARVLTAWRRGDTIYRGGSSESPSQGLMLLRASVVDSLGGTISLWNEAGGAHVQIRIPLPECVR